MTYLEKLTPPGENRTLWTLHLTGGEIIKVTDAEAADFALYTGMELPEDTLSALRSAAAEGVLRRKAGEYLSRRLCSRGELLKKLAGKGAAPDSAARIADWAERIGLLDDARYAQAVLDHYRRMGYGPYRIRQEMYRRMVPKEHWEPLLEKEHDNGDAIARFLQKKLHDPDDRAEIRRVSAALARRGYSWDEISRGIEAFRASRPHGDHHTETDWGEYE